jgi:thiamine-phosphate pyrophosphorylase
VAACEAGDVASLVVQPGVAKEVVELAQKKGVAVLATGGPLGSLDGLHVDAGVQSVAEARKLVGANRIVGAFAGGSRHLAMEAAEQGADYVALSQKGASLGGEPIVKWWAEVMEIPCVAYEPVEISDLDTLLPQSPDFIRPSDRMWESAEAARSVVQGLMQRLRER